MVLRVFRSNRWLGSKPRTNPVRQERKPRCLRSGSIPIPEQPSCSERLIWSSEVPRLETAPIPVMTARFIGDDVLLLRRRGPQLHPHPPVHTDHLTSDISSLI